MSACEKCWGDAYLRTLYNPVKSQAGHYLDLLKERKDKPCTPEEQAGEEAMSYDTDIECGEELARDIESGLIAEDQLTESGKRKLAAFRLQQNMVSLDFETGSDADLEFLGYPQKG